MNLLERRATRRGLLAGGVTFIGGILAAACARPEAKTAPPSPTSLPTIAPTPRPTETLTPTPQPTSTETPKSVEELVKSGWRRQGNGLYRIYTPSTWSSVGRAPVFGAKTAPETNWHLFYSKEMANTVSPSAMVEISILSGRSGMNFDDFVKTFRQEVQQVTQGRIPVTETRIQLDGQEAIRVDGKTFGQIHPIPIGGGYYGEEGFYETRIGFIRQGEVWHFAFGMWTTGFREKDEVNRQIMGGIFNKMLSSFKFLQ